MTEIEKRDSILESIKKVLCEKNKRYGNSALEPLNIFYKGSATNSINIRLDDKLSRIKNASTLRKNDMYDLLGYLFLLRISVSGLPNLTFAENVDCIIDDVKNIGLPELVDVPESERENLFDKDNTNDKTLVALNNLIYYTKHGLGNSSMIGMPTLFITYIVQYFIDNNISDFTDLID